MQELGHNFRITDIQCALGKLSRSSPVSMPLSGRRRAIVDRYNEAFAKEFLGSSARPYAAPARSKHISWHLYTLKLSFDVLGKMSRTQVMKELLGKGVNTQGVIHSSSSATLVPQ